jgi:dTDP-glucose 4,6-dehydratase
MACPPTPHTPPTPPASPAAPASPTPDRPASRTSRPRHLLITGGAGFIGSNLVRHVLATTSDTVTVLDALTYAANPVSLIGLPQDRVELVVGDVADPAIVGPLVREADAVVHLAAASHNDASLVDPTPFVHTNIQGTVTVLEAVRRHGTRLHHVSTDEVFGQLDLDDPARFTEHSAYDPTSPYSAGKASADHLVRAWARSFDLPVTLSTSSNTYGPRQHVEKFIPRQVTNILDGVRPRLYGEGREVRDWIHVDDHVRAILAILEHGTLGETYLVGADGERSNREVLDLVLELMNQGADAFDHVRARPAHDQRYALDPARLREELGWRPVHPDLREGLTQTITWYRENETWWRPQKAATEAEYRRRGWG